MLGRPRNPRVSLFASDEIERALQDYAAANGFVPIRPTDIGPELQDFERRGLAPLSTRAFVEALRVMNEASHGVPVDPDAAEHAAFVGTVFLAEFIEQTRDA